MPCALEAQTVIKTFCLRLAIPTFWRIGESKKLGVFKTTQTQKQQNNEAGESDEPSGPKDMVCIILYVSLTMQGHGSTKARDGHRYPVSDIRHLLQVVNQA